MSEERVWRRKQEVLGGTLDAPTCDVLVTLNKVPPREWLVAFARAASPFTGCGFRPHPDGTLVITGFPTERLEQFNTLFDESIEKTYAVLAGQRENAAQQADLERAYRDSLNKRLNG